MMKRQVKMLILATLLLIAGYIAATAVSIILYSKVDEKQTADVATILGAATYDGEVSPVYRGRIDHGIWLYQNGYVKALIMTGGFGDGNSVSDAYAAKEYAVSLGLPEDAILLEEMSSITQENIKFAKEIMDRNSLKTAILVSDPLHMKRAMLMAKDYGISAYSSPTPVSAYKTWKTKLPFLMREEFFYVGYRIYRVFKVIFR